MTNKNETNNFGVVKKLGDNYIVKDTPCLIPTQNIRMYNTMRKQASVSSFGNFPNPFNDFWKK